MTNPSHHTLVANQFSPRAANYVESAVHAQGADLARAAALAGQRRPARVLDLGCGGGHLSYALAPQAGEVTAYDLSAEMLAAVAAEAGRRQLGNIRTFEGAVERLPFADASFDMVASRFSAHHWRDVRQGLGEARRVVKPDGLALFIDCVAPEATPLDTYMQAIELLRDPSHVRDYSPAEWTRLLTEVGFAPEAPELWRLRLDFASWIKRMATPETHVRAIQSLHGLASQEVREYFAIEADGSFTLDVMMVLARPQAG